MNLKNLGQLLATIMSERERRDRRNVITPKPTALVEQCVAITSKHDDEWIDSEAELILAGYRSLDDAGRVAFLLNLAEVLNPSLTEVENAIRHFLKHPGPDAVRALHTTATPPRHLLFSRLNEADDGTAQLVDMRRTILNMLKANPHLAPLEADLRLLLSSWFNRAFLVLQRIDWSSPANVLIRIIDYEAVHEIKDWDDLRRRIDPPDRACFAFFHPLLADDPLIFVEVALTQDVPQSIGELLADSRTPLEPEKANCAVFYSISNCQAGLRGISFGNMLIKTVINEIVRSMPKIRKFVTLSPIPGFAEWIRDRAKEGDAEALKLLQVTGPGDDPERPPAPCAAVADTIRQLGAQYLLSARRDDGLPVDSVARFHLGNGARVEQLHWPADDSAAGLLSSFGLMVSYRYDLSDIQTNQESFRSRETVPASRSIKKLARTDS